MEEKLCEPPSFKPEEIATDLLQIVEEDDEEMNEETRAEMLKMRKDREAQNLNAVEGNVAHNYIKLEPQNYTQFEVITFFQTELQKLLSDVRLTSSTSRVNLKSAQRFFPSFFFFLGRK